MNSIQKTQQRLYPSFIRLAKMSQVGDVGKGGGDGRSSREAARSYGKTEAAQEEEYFFLKQQKQLRKLKEAQISQKGFHEQQIKELESAIHRHKQYLSNIQPKTQTHV